MHKMKSKLSKKNDLCELYAVRRTTTTALYAIHLALRRIRHDTATRRLQRTGAYTTYVENSPTHQKRATRTSMVSGEGLVSCGHPGLPSAAYGVAKKRPRVNSVNNNASPGSCEEKYHQRWRG